MPDNPSKNPYSSAASAYGDHAQKHSPDQREVEARVLLKAATQMQELQQSWNADDFARIDDVLKFNRNIWMMFFDTALENKDGGEEGRPDTLRSNIINLATFIFKRTVDILADPAPQKLDVLVAINREIAAGLMTPVANPPGSNTPPQKKGGSSSTATSA